MGGCQNYDPFLGTLSIRCRIIIGIQKGTIILTTTHIGFRQGAILATGARSTKSLVEGKSVDMPH